MVGRQGLEDLNDAIECYDSEITADREALISDAFPDESEGEEEGGQSMYHMIHVTVGPGPPVFSCFCFLLPACPL